VARPRRATPDLPRVVGDVGARSSAEKVNPDAHRLTVDMYGYTVCQMHPTVDDDSYTRVNERLEDEARLLLRLILASGATLLGFLGWLLTL
jgi:hypothetical protein